MTLPRTPAAALALIAGLTAAPLAAQTASTPASPPPADQNRAEASGAPSDAPPAADARVFAPLVHACVAAPGADDCGPVRAVVSECARDLDYARCEVLFVEPDEVFADTDAAQAAHQMLADAADAIAAMGFAADDDVVEAARADAERTMLRGDENLNAHSAPPVIAD